VAVNCPTLPESVLETELFGYAKGAFTDAKADKRGLFQEAHGGTIFLDEIGELPLSLQAKLLRVLQEREIKPLGHPRTIRVDVRVVASTNRDLRRRLAEGLFREDLFYRLNVIAIALPPLRERRDDIPILADHFLKAYARDLGRPGLHLSPDALDLLVRERWPGNVRELQNTVRRGAIMARGEAVQPGALGLEHRVRPAVASHLYHLRYRDAKEQILAQFNEEFLNNALAQDRGNVTRAARRLGLERQALQQLLRRYDIDTGRHRSGALPPGEEPAPPSSE
jgi:transcriptional regulator with GAF, ATPase, and Fis domain